MSPTRAVSAPEVLLAAQQDALSHDERLDTLTLNAVKRGVPDLPVAEAITRAIVTLTIDGPSTLQLDIHDPTWLIERSGVLAGDSGRLQAIDVAVDSLPFRLAKAARRVPETLSLTFEDQAKALLEQHDRRRVWRRGTVTRAQAIEAMVREVKARKLLFWAPEKGRKQPEKLPDFPDARPSAGDTGFDAGARFDIKGVEADARQMREVATALNVADQEGAKGRARLALLVAGIGESSFRDVPNAAGSPYGGVFQSLKTRNLTTAQEARYFLRGGQGFQGGGAIKLARDNPSWTAGHIAYVVEGSRANFASDAEAERHYQQWIDEARKINGLWNSGGSGDSTVVRAKDYMFTRGLPGRKENSWQAMTRLASEVQWRLFAIGGAIWLVSDDHLISQPAALILDGETADGDWQLPGGLLEWPSYDQDHGKPAQSITLRAHANAWGVRPGNVIVLRNMGQISGRWIVETFEFNLLSATEAQVTLVKPLAPRKEPAAETVAVDTSSPATGGAARTLTWARGKLGHYAEEWGQNRGRELDELEAGFGFRGAAWCAMFVTTALVHGGVGEDCRTASVAQIRQWAHARSHGYRSFTSLPKPGDLMLFGNEHVALVEKVNDNSVTTIEGNTSADKVTRLTRAISSGEFVRPDYPN